MRVINFLSMCHVNTITFHVLVGAGKTFNGDSQDTESYFQKSVIKERSKFDRETKATTMIQGSSSSSLVIVTLVVALTGRNNPSYKSVRSLSDTREILQALAADAMTVRYSYIFSYERVFVSHHEMASRTMETTFLLWKFFGRPTHQAQ